MEEGKTSVHTYTAVRKVPRHSHWRSAISRLRSPHIFEASCGRRAAKLVWSTPLTLTGVWLAASSSGRRQRHCPLSVRDLLLLFAFPPSVWACRQQHSSVRGRRALPKFYRMPPAAWRKVGGGLKQPAEVSIVTYYPSLTEPTIPILLPNMSIKPSSTAHYKSRVAWR